MRTYDFTPLFRSTVGLTAGTTCSTPRCAPMTAPRAIRRTTSRRRAVGHDVEITAQENLLVVSGNLGEPREGVTYLYRGIATRAFERRFSLADHVKVVGATLADGVLQVDLERELPEAMKPRRIAVESKPGSGTKMIEGKKVVEAKKAA